MNSAEYCTIKAFMDSHKDMDDMVDVSSVASYMKKAICNKTVTVKQLEEMYDKFQKKLWSVHEDVRGDDMIEVGYAEQFLQDLLGEFGCWDEEMQNE